MKIDITFTVDLPELSNSDEEIEEFLRFEFRDNGVLSGDNPFNQAGTTVDPIFGSFEWIKKEASHA